MTFDYGDSLERDATLPQPPDALGLHPGELRYEDFPACFFGERLLNQLFESPADLFSRTASAHSDPLERIAMIWRSLPSEDRKASGDVGRTFANPAHVGLPGLVRIWPENHPPPA